ncbi:MAG: hypothetical protein AAGE90_19005 [Pseudomonadota bacterium]
MDKLIDEPLITRARVCALLSLSPRTIRRLELDRKSGFPQPVKLRGSKRYDAAAVTAWARSQREDAA